MRFIVKKPPIPHIKDKNIKETKHLKSHLASCISTYELKRKKNNSCLLTWVSTNYIGTVKDFKMLRLFLKVGSDPSTLFYSGYNLLKGCTALLAQGMMRWH
jgi:hypothetical protein